MGVLTVRRVDELGPDCVLAPERHDPRRRVDRGASVALDTLVELARSGVRGLSGPVLVLDTSHAWEGVVLARHAPAGPEAIGSAKRSLAPGDVVVSRLRPYLRQVAYVDAGLFALDPAGNAVCASTEFFVLRGRGGFPAAALVPFLLSDRVQAALAAGQEGGHHPRFPEVLLRGLQVPDALVADAAAVAAEVVALAAAVRHATLAGRALSARW
jgi:hypothetical protein